MSTSHLYDTTAALFAQRLPTVRDSQIETMSLLVVGVVQSLSSQLAKIARALPLDTTQVAKEQRVRRFLDNERITQVDHYHPILKEALHGLRGQRVQLVLDRVVLQETHNILVLSLAFRRRSIPLMWVALAHQGSSSLADRQALLTAAVPLLPTGVRISVHGDSEFRGQAFFRWLREQGYDVMLGGVGSGLVSSTPNGMDDAGQSTTRTLAEWVGDQQGVVYLTNVYVGEAQYGPVNILAWWERDDDGKRLVRGAWTNLPATTRTKRLGKRRMWIETVFRDWQSGGFHLDQSGITDRERMERLLLIIAIAYLWLVCVGRWVVKRGYRTKIDTGAPHRWQFSLFQLGVGWLQRLHSFGQSLPLLLLLYL